MLEERKCSVNKGLLNYAQNTKIRGCHGKMAEWVPILRPAT